MIQFKLTFDKDLEQEWINNFCQEGWAMTGFVAGFFTFTPCQPGEYIYQIDLLPGDGFKAKNVSEYVEFMEETGVESSSGGFAGYSCANGRRTDHSRSIRILIPRSRCTAVSGRCFYGRWYWSASALSASGSMWRLTTAC